MLSSHWATGSDSQSALGFIPLLFDRVEVNLSSSETQSCEKNVFMSLAVDSRNRKGSSLADLGVPIYGAYSSETGTVYKRV